MENFKLVGKNFRNFNNHFSNLIYFSLYRAIPVKSEIGKWFLAIIVLALPVYLAIGSISMLIKGIIEGFKAETSPISKGILICSLVSLTIGIYELYWFLFKGSKLGLVLVVLSFVISYICFYLWKEK